MIAGAGRLRRLVGEYTPGWLAVVGVTAYRSGFQRPQATVGQQSERLGETGIWVLPNPSGLNAHYQIDALAEEFAKLRGTALGG